MKIFLQLKFLQLVYNRAFYKKKKKNVKFYAIIIMYIVQYMWHHLSLFNEIYHSFITASNIYLPSCGTSSINDIAIFVLVARDYALIYRVKFSRQFGKIVPRGHARAASRPFAAGYYCHSVHNTRATTNPRAGETWVHSSAFTDRISGLSGPFRARFHHDHDS